MDHLPDPAAIRTAVCPEHGEFESRNIIGRVWSKCVECEAVARQAREEVEAKQAQAAMERRHAERLHFARIPARFVGRTFDTFKAETEAQKHAQAVARDFAEQFADNHKHGRGLIFSGLPGTGKSHLAAAILQTMLKRDVCYVTCLDMIREVRGAWRKDSDRSELEVLGTLGGIDLLVIDEVGVQYGTEGEQTIIFDVLDRRYRDVLPTVILTNQDKAGFKAFIGERTFDRLTETCRWVPFDWSSYRAQARKDDNAQSREVFVPTSEAFRGAV
jgi:DNA replication protein DnaC